MIKSFNVTTLLRYVLNCRFDHKHIIQIRYYSLATLLDWRITMHNIEKKLETIFQKAFPGAELTPCNTNITLNLKEPSLIGLSVQSVGFEFAPQGECMRASLCAENNGVPVKNVDDLAEHIEIKLDEEKLRIHDMAILSLSDFKRVIKDHYCM